MNGEKIPGTALDMVQGAQDNVFSIIAPIIKITGGLTLSQVCEITGLEGSTIQNWVKRGWVAKPEGKRYNELQIARIILINMLRGAMTIESSVTLMEYVNGSVEDRSDDIIPDRELIDLVCSIVFDSDGKSAYDTKSISALVEKKVQGREVFSVEPSTGKEANSTLTDKTATRDASIKLCKALTVMVLACKAAALGKATQREFETLF